MLSHYDESIEIIICDDKFKQGISDLSWIPKVGSMHPKPAVISGDGRILSNKAELATLQECGLTFFCLAPGWTNLAHEQYCWKLIHAFEEIVAANKKARRPTVFKVKPNGKVERICLLSELK